MEDFSLEDLVNMKLDNANLPGSTYDDYVETKVEKKKKKKSKKVMKEEESDSDSDDRYKKTHSTCMLSSKMREVIIIYVLFVVLASRLSAGQADRVMRIQSPEYSIYDLMARGIVMVLLFYIFCRLFK